MSDVKNNAIKANKIIGSSIDRNNKLGIYYSKYSRRNDGWSTPTPFKYNNPDYNAELMTFTQAKEMELRGWEIGSHTLSHWPLSVHNKDNYPYLTLCPCYTSFKNDRVFILLFNILSYIKILV